ncbi:MAG: hypothetical protein P1P82_16085 [Bacteroidales bacterium]|nr:hypothetical protein [Bacteroidales bacterium]MDT8432678.1 hypothetical protein [Bacteroidales bacterium]
MKAPQQYLLILILLIPVQLKSQEYRRTGVGWNLPALIGKTIVFDADISKNKFYGYSIGIGGMLNNSLRGTLYEIGEATYNHENSGYYFSGGLRYTPRKEFNQTYFFIGVKLLGGYFLQSAEYHEPFNEWFRDNKIPEDYYFEGDKVYSEGLFTAFVFETGINVKFTNRFHTEIGFQGGHHIYTTKRQVSSISSILPGLGALNIAGILKIKYIIEKNIG